MDGHLARIRQASDRGAECEHTRANRSTEASCIAVAPPPTRCLFWAV